MVAVALGTLGGNDNLNFLVAEIANRKATIDTQWSIADSLLLFNPAEVTEHAIAPMRAVPELHAQAAYMIGRLRVAIPGTREMQFLVDLVRQSPNVNTRGVALKALGRLGATQYREDCELMAAGRWDKVARHKEEGGAPAFLFTGSHGVKFRMTDPTQRDRQGAWPGWVARNDARNYVILGDPAVRLRTEAMQS